MHTTGATGSVAEFNESWNVRAHEARQNYYTAGVPVNQIMLSFKNQWEVYRSFLGDIRPGARSLEPGSGRGSISCYFAAAGYDAYLLDTSAEILRVAEDIFAENELAARFVPADCLAMPFLDGFFDVIVHCGLLEHFDDPRPVLAESLRLLKPGGLLWKTIFNVPTTDVERHPRAREEYVAIMAELGATAICRPYPVQYVDVLIYRKPKHENKTAPVNGRA